MIFDSAILAAVALELALTAIDYVKRIIRASTIIE